MYILTLGHSSQVMNTPRIDLKSVQRYICIEMISLHSARRLFVLPRPKKRNQTLNQKCRKLDLYGEMGMRKLGECFSQRQEGPGRQDPFTPEGLLLKSWVEKFSSAFSGAKKNVYILSRKVPIFLKICIIRPRAPSFWPGKSSLAPPILVR